MSTYGFSGENVKRQNPAQGRPFDSREELADFLPGVKLFGDGDGGL